MSPIEKGHVVNKCPTTIAPLLGHGTHWCSLYKSRTHSDEARKPQMGTSSSSAPTTAKAVYPASPLHASDSPTHELSTEPFAFAFLTSASHITPSQVVELLVDSGCSAHILETCLIFDLHSHVKESVRLEPLKIAHGMGLDELQVTSTAVEGKTFERGRDGSYFVGATGVWVSPQYFVLAGSSVEGCGNEHTNISKTNQRQSHFLFEVQQQLIHSRSNHFGVIISCLRADL